MPMTPVRVVVSIVVLFALTSVISLAGDKALMVDPSRPLPLSTWLSYASQIDGVMSSLEAPVIMTAGTCDTAGPIEVESSGGTLAGTPTAYATLSGLVDIGAFATINAGVKHTGTITIDVCGDTNEGTATATLSPGNVAPGNWTTMTISPAGGAARTISGTTTAGAPMIEFNGADNVTVNGLNTGGNSLTISNTTASATSGTATIRFTGEATGNTITNSTILGSFSGSVATNGGNIFFSTSTAGGIGNDNNTISNNNIGPAGANLPTKGILCNGSTTTTAIGNSGLVIDNNNIFDYFGAAVTSSGIAVNGGCNTFSITNNRFYQTAPRTWTTGATHRAIDLNSTTSLSGVQGMTVTGNIIGYATNTQTGTYSLSGSTGKFQGIFHNGISTGTTSTINNNTVAAISMTGVTSSGTSTSSPFVGILFQEGNGITNSNTIGSQASTGSLTFSTTTTSGTDVYGIYNFSSNNWTSNTNNIGGISVTNLGASGTFVLYGMRAFTASTTPWTATSNLVGGTVANSIQLNATGAASQVVGMFTSNCPLVLTSNTVRNLTSNIGTGLTTGASVVGILTSSTTPNSTLSQNTIFNLSNSNAAAGSVVTGIQFTGSTANLVERNFIHSLTVATNSTTAEVNGIRVGGGTTTYRNNMIAVGAGISNAIGTGVTAGISGINEPAGTNNFFHNSVYIGGSPSGGVGPSFAFNSTITTNTRSVRDNIFYNGRANSTATGKNYAIRVGGTTPAPAGLTLNNNLYLANAPGGVFGFFNSLDVANLAAWKTAVGLDASSFESNPQYLDPNNVTPDLHLNPGVATVAEGNGSDVGVTDDFDGQTRASLTPVDIGADAGNFIGLDLAAPVISYAPLTNTSVTTNRVLSVTISDSTGVATGALAPRIYFNKNAGSYVSTSCALTSGTVNNGTWDCTIDNALLGGVVGPDLIRYFVVAQDTVGNLGSNPSAGFSGTNVNTVTTPPTTPNQYFIVIAFSGSFNVGTGEAFTSLTNSGGIFEAINAGSLSGNVTINITTDLVAETGTVALNQFAEDGVGGYTILIKPSSFPKVIAGNFNGALVRLNGADRVRIDGSTAASLTDDAENVVGGDPSLRQLTISNVSTGTSAVVLSIGSNAADGAQNNTVKNVNVLGQDPTTTLLGISLGGATPGTIATGPNNGNRVENCSIKRAIFGIYSAGVSAASQNTGTVITQNETSAVTGDRIRRVGIVVFNENGVQITENSINGINNTGESADVVGIGVGAQGTSNTDTTNGGVTNATVARNRINGVTNDTTFGANGIAVAGGTTGANTIVNNMITGVISDATSPDNPSGIWVAGVTGSSTRLYHNSISMTGDRSALLTPGTGQHPSYGVAITGTNPTVELKNNIFYTTQFAEPVANPSAKTYAIGMVSTTFAALDSNYNDFWSTGSLDGGFRSGSLAAAAGTDYASLALWQVAVSDDANSQEVDPSYTDPLADLHLNSGSTPLTDDGIAGFATNDFDGQSRPQGVAPEPGADEVLPATSPDINLQGGTPFVDIANNDATPSVTDGTDFGGVNVISGTTTVNHTFNIQNLGTADLNLTSGPFVILGGPDAAQFQVTSQPFPPIVPTDASTFEIRFDPTTTGLKTATVTIASNDPDENPYVFTIQGTGTAHTEPTLTATGTNPTFNAGGGAVDLYSGVTVLTNDAGQTLTRLEFFISNLQDGTDEKVNADGTTITLIDGANGTTALNGFSYFVSKPAGTATVSLTKAGGVSEAAMTTVVDGLSYVNTNVNPTPAVRGASLSRLDDSGSNTPPNDNRADIAIGSNITVNGGAGTVQFSSATYSIGEAGPQVTLTVTRTGGSTGAVQVNYALSGGTATGGPTCTGPTDYVSIGGSVNFANGDAASKTFNVSICEDTIYEGNETFNATLSIGSGSATLGTPNPAAVTITENDVQPSFAFTSATYLVNEGVGVGSFQVNRSGAVGGTDTVSAATVGGGTATGGAACTAGVDYVLATPTLTFNPGDTNKTLDVIFCQDSRYENPNETVNIALSSPSGLTTLGTPNTAVVTINDDDTVPTLQFTSATYSNNDDIAEGLDKETVMVPEIATITVTRTGAIENVVTVNYATVAGGTATSGVSCTTGVDYVPSSGTLTFNAGITSQTFPVTVCSDLLFEGDETVNLAITSPGAPAVLGTPNTAVLTLVDNETVPTFVFSSATYSNSDDLNSLGETTEEFAPSVATITVNRTGATANAVTVNYATSNGTATGGASCTVGIDYITTSGTLSFGAGVTSQTFNVTVCTDTLFEGNETVNLALSSPSVPATLGVPNSAVLTIVDNDAQPSLQFSSATYSVSEAGPTATITVTRTGAPDNAVGVSYATSNGTATGGASCVAGVDYQNASGTLNFASGDTSKTFTVTICDDALSEGDETVNLTLTSPTGGAVLGSPSTAVLTITDNDGTPSIQFSTSTDSVSEGAGTITFSVTRTGATGNAVGVSYTTGGISATGGASCTTGVDFVSASGTLAFAAGETLKTFNVTICNDNLFESSETFAGSLVTPTGGAVLGAPSVETVTITENDTAPTFVFSSSTYSVGEGGGTATITVSRTGATENAVSVNFGSAAGGTATGGASCIAGVDYVTPGGTLNFLSGDTSKTFTVTICDDNVFEGDETVNLALSGATGPAVLGTPNTAVLTITDNDTVPTFQFSSATYSAGEGVGSATITVTRTGAAGNAVSVNYATSNGTAVGGVSCSPAVDFQDASGTLNFLAGDTSKTFNVTICDDSLFEISETFNLALSSPTAPSTLGTPNTAVFTITDNDTQPTLQFSSATYSNSDDVANAVGATITVTRTGATGNAVSVNYATSNGTATGGASCTPGVDYVNTSGTLNFASGETSKIFIVLVCTDNLFEGSETVNLALTSPSAPAVLGTPNTAVLTLTDNETQPTLQFSSATYSAGEGAGTTTITVSRTGATDNVVSVNYATSNGTATGGASCVAGVDYINASGTLNFALGVTSQTFNVTICEDASAEGNETVNLALSTPGGGAAIGAQSTAVLTINDNDGDTTAPVITYTPIPSNPGATSVTVTITDTVGVTSATIFWKINSGSFTSAACTPAGGTPQNGTWTCTITGAPNPSAVSYYVTASDAAANTGSNPSGGASAPNLFTIGGATIPGGTYTNIVLGTVPITIGGNLDILQNLTLGGFANAGTNTITLECNATITGGGETAYVVGYLEKKFCSIGVFKFEVGAAFVLPPPAPPEGEETPATPEGVISNYSPVTVNVIGGDVGSSLTVKAFDERLAGFDPTRTASRNWSITENGNLTVDLSLTYRNEDVVGNESDYRAYRAPGGAPIVNMCPAVPCVNIASNTVTVNAVSDFSRWGVAELLVPTAAPLGISGRVVDTSGRGIRNATLLLEGGGLTEPRIAASGSMGYYSFENLPPGTYMLTVSGKRHVFAVPSRMVNLADDITDFDFVGEPRE